MKNKGMIYILAVCMSMASIVGYAEDLSGDTMVSEYIIEATGKRGWSRRNTNGSGTKNI